MDFTQCSSKPRIFLTGRMLLCLWTFRLCLLLNNQELHISHNLRIILIGRMLCLQTLRLSCPLIKREYQNTIQWDKNCWFSTRNQWEVRRWWCPTSWLLCSYRDLKSPNFLVSLTTKVRLEVIWSEKARKSIEQKFKKPFWFQKNKRASNLTEVMAGTFY